jgi:oligosaccharide repeat unit polymerase
MLELIVPVLVVLAMRSATTPRGRRVAAMLPVVFVPFVVIVFGAFEYFRSWVYFRERSNGTFAQFAVERLVGYYATALNNGALQMTYNRFPGRWPYETMAAFWSAPGISNLDLYQKLNGQDHETAYFDILTNYGTPEFNNSSGLAAPFVDFGFIGGLVYLFGTGVILGLLYRGFRESTPLGVLIYPVLFIGVVELPRYLAFSQGRVFPTLVALVAITVLLKRVGAGRGAQS